MLKGITRNWKFDVVIFLFLIVVVAITQHSLLKSQLQYGFTPDDWWPLYEYKLLVNSDPITSLKQIWERHGIYTAYQIYYIGTLEKFFGFNFYNYNLTNQIFKALSVLSLYPLILIIFKRRLLAILAVILYGISFSPVGTLEITAKGTDYLAISIMNIFVIAYYYVIKGRLKGIKWTAAALVIMLIGLLLSPIRMYPMLILVFLVEAYLFFKTSDEAWRSRALKRLAILYCPFILAFLITPGSFTRFIFIHPGPIIHFVSIGNWQMLLSPVASLGSTFVTDWRMFGVYNLENFTEYLSFITGGPIVIYAALTLFLAIILSKRPIRFFLTVFLTNLILELLTFFVITHQRTIPSSLQIGYDLANIYPILGGIYVSVLSYFFYREWRNRGTQSNVLLALWTSMVFSLSFIWLTWILSDHAIVFKGIHSYLTVPAAGTSVFIAGLITASFDKIRALHFKMINQLCWISILAIILIYFQSDQATTNYLDSALRNGMDAKEQQTIRNKLWDKVENYDSNIPNLFFLDTREDLPNGRFYEISTVANFGKWAFFWSGQNKDRCKLPQFIVYDKEKLTKSVNLKDGKKKIIYPDSCGVETTYGSQNFYAFKLMKREPIDIKKQLLEEVGVE